MTVEDVGELLDLDNASSLQKVGNYQFISISLTPNDGHKLQLQYRQVTIKRKISISSTTFLANMLAIGPSKHSMTMAVCRTKYRPNNKSNDLVLSCIVKKRHPQTAGQIKIMSASNLYSRYSMIQDHIYKIQCSRCKYSTAPPNLF